MIHDLVESDVRIDTDTTWWLQADSCPTNGYALEAVMTHEFGHSFGLGHVTSSEASTQTMYWSFFKTCSNGKSNLGRGDVLGLRSLY